MGRHPLSLQDEGPPSPSPSVLPQPQHRPYYESLCPDSTRFIADQIPETWSALKEDISINFVPYGFAKTTERPDGSYTFKCQHGERECKGNKIQACTAHLFSDNPDTVVSLITCMMDTNAPDMAGPQCYQKQGEDYSLVEDCLSSGLGDKLHAAAGEATANYRPRIDNVPWLNFDGEHVAEYWDLETVGLLNYLCQQFQLNGCP